MQDLQANLTREKQNNTMLSTQVISLTNKLAEKDEQLISMEEEKTLIVTMKA